MNNTNKLNGKYLNWENCKSFENSNSWTWITTYSNNVACLLERNMFCVNLIVLQKDIFSFVYQTKLQHVCTIARNLRFSQPSAYSLENGRGYAYPRLRTFVLYHTVLYCINKLSVKFLNVASLTFDKPMAASLSTCSILY